MDVHELLSTALNFAHRSFTNTVTDLTQEMLDWLPPGIAHPIGERYAHLVFAEDWLVNGMARSGELLAASTWAGRTGFGKIELQASSEQARAFHADLNALHAYRAAVFAESEGYLMSLGPKDLDRVFDMSMAGMPQVPAPLWWEAFIISHVHDLMGEISALKGCQGAKGYPY
jgi:hypothetical protein